jgi:hypothetical protein
MYTQLAACVVCLALSASIAKNHGPQSSSVSPAVEVHSFRADGQTVDWDFPLRPQSGELRTRPAASGSVEFVDVGGAQRPVAVALEDVVVEATLPHLPSVVLRWFGSSGSPISTRFGPRRTINPASPAFADVAARPGPGPSS